jgi:dTDP-4-dehydrorhamnose 3,5-epimerase
MIIKKSKKLGLDIIYLDNVFTDHRGQYIESFNKKKYKSLFNLNFVEDDFSVNKKNVFKGIHGDKKTWKLVSCVYGKCEAVIVNCDKKSKKFGIWEKFILSPSNYYQILIPPYYGNSFLVLSKIAVYHYKQSRYYQGINKQFTYNYKDPVFKIKLSYKKPIVSLRDSKANFINI